MIQQLRLKNVQIILLRFVRLENLQVLALTFNEVIIVRVGVHLVEPFYRPARTDKTTP